MSFKGRVKAFREDKGFGFIVAEDDTEVFVHAAACVDGGQPQQGDELVFDVEESKMKPGQMQACNVSGGTGQMFGGKGKGKVDTGGPLGSSKGEIKSFVRDPGYGFIIAEDGQEVFCHLRAVVDGSVPQKGDTVTYDVEPSKSKPGTMAACNVRGGSGMHDKLTAGNGGDKDAWYKGGFGAAKGGDSWGGGGKGGPYGGDSWGGKGGDSWGGGKSGGNPMMEGMRQIMMSMMGGGGGGKGSGGWGGDGWGGKGDGKGWGGKCGW